MVYVSGLFVYFFLLPIAALVLRKLFRVFAKLIHHRANRTQEMALLLMTLYLSVGRQFIAVFWWG